MSDNSGYPENSRYPEYSEHPGYPMNPGPWGEPAPRQPAPQQPVPEQPAPGKPVRGRRRIGAVAGIAVLLAAVVAGAGYTVVTVQGADRDPGAPVWRLPSAAEGKQDKGKKETAAGGGLKGMLLPYGADQYGQGPDIGEFGSDAELSGREATALRKESIKDLPRSQRRELERQIDRQRIKGMAMRSYLSDANATNFASSAETAFTLDIVLSRMENQRTVRSIAVVQQEFFDAMKIFRKGPTIEGHKNAACFLPPADSREKLDMMVCSAYVGDVLVSATATGRKPLNEKSVASMLSDQLDRIKDPGEAV